MFALFVRTCEPTITRIPRIISQSLDLRFFYVELKLYFFYRMMMPKSYTFAVFGFVRRQWRLFVFPFMTNAGGVCFFGRFAEGELWCRFRHFGRIRVPPPSLARVRTECDARGAHNPGRARWGQGFRLGSFLNV